MTLEKDFVNLDENQLKLRTKNLIDKVEKDKDLNLCIARSFLFSKRGLKSNS